MGSRIDLGRRLQSAVGEGGGGRPRRSIGGGGDCRFGPAEAMLGALDRGTSASWVRIPPEHVHLATA